MSLDACRVKRARPAPLAREHHGGFAARPMLQGLARRLGFIFFTRIPGFVERTLTVREPPTSSRQLLARRAALFIPLPHGARRTLTDA